MDNIWDAGLGDMQLSSKFNKGIYFLMCVIDIFSKYAWIANYPKTYLNFKMKSRRTFSSPFSMIFWIL